MNTTSLDLNSRIKVLVFFVATLTVLGTTWIIGVQIHTTQWIRREAANHLHRVPQLLDQEVTSTVRALRCAALELQANTTLTDVVGTADRAAVRAQLETALPSLAKLTAPIHISIHTANGMKLAQANVDARGHMAIRLGGTETVDAGHVPPNGLTRGPDGTIFARVMQTIRSGGQRVGYCVLRADLGATLRRVKSDTAANVAIIHCHTGRPTDGERPSRSTVAAIGPATESVPPLLRARLNASHKRPLSAADSVLHITNIRYRLIPLRDPGGTVIGKLLAWRDYSNDLASNHRFLLILVSVTIATVAFFTLGFWSLVTRIQNRFVAMAVSQESEIKKRQLAETTLQTHLDEARELAREHRELATSLAEEVRRREVAEMYLRRQRDQLKCHAEQMECLHAIGGAIDRDTVDIKMMLDGTLKHLRAYYRDVDRVWLRIEIDECTVQRGCESGESCDCRMEIPIRSAHRSIGNLQVSVGIGEDGVEAARTRARDIDFLKLVGDKIGQSVERQRAMITLRSSEEQRTKMADAAHDAFIMIDDRGTVTFWNRAAEQIFGLPRDEALGEALHEIIVPESMLQQHRQQFAKYCRTGQGPVVGKTVELEARRKNGELFPAELSLSSVCIDGRWHAIGIVRDITERKEANRALQEKEHQLRQAQKMEAVGVLAGGIAHEFNNLLQVICGYTEFALRDLPSDAPVANDLNRVMAAGRRAASLTRQLLDFSRREPVTGSRLDLNRSAREVISMLKPITRPGALGIPPRPGATGHIWGFRRAGTGTHELVRQ